MLIFKVIPNYDEETLLSKIVQKLHDICSKYNISSDKFNLKQIFHFFKFLKKNL